MLVVFFIGLFEGSGCEILFYLDTAPIHPSEALAMQEFVLVDKYVKLILLFTGFLIQPAPLEMHNPGHRNAFAELDGRSRPMQPTRQFSQLDGSPTEVWGILRDGICKLYYGQHSAFAALKDPIKFYGCSVDT